MGGCCTQGDIMYPIDTEPKKKPSDVEISACIDIAYMPSDVKVSAYIILIHGLDGDYKSFINKKHNISLQKLLSNDFPSCTILNYTYPNKASNFGQGAKPFETIKQRANNFLQLLLPYINQGSNSASDDNKENDDNKNDKDTPIIFIGHSMGGLIIKSALEIASHPNSTEHFIYQRFKGCVFYAVPHRGSCIATLYNKIPKCVPYLGPTDSINNLKKDDAYLVELMSSFNELISNHPRYSDKNAKTKCILSLIEQQDEPIAGGAAVRIVDVASSQCYSPHEKCVYMDCYHTNICKPRNAKDPRFAQLAHFLSVNMKIPYQGAIV